VLLHCTSQTMLSVCRNERSSMFQCGELIPEVCPRISGILCIHYKILHSLGSQKCHLRFLRVWPTNQPTKKFVALCKKRWDTPTLCCYYCKLYIFNSDTATKVYLF